MGELLQLVQLRLVWAVGGTVPNVIAHPATASEQGRTQEKLSEGPKNFQLPFPPSPLPFPFHPLCSLLSPPLSFSSLFFPLFPFLPQIQLGGLGERCKLSSRVWG